MSMDAAVLALLDRIEQLERGTERTATQSVPLVIGNQFITDGGTIPLPGLAWFGDPDTGLARPGPDEVALVAGGGVAFRVTSVAATTTRSYLADATYDGSLMQLLRGNSGNSVTPVSTTPAFYVLAFHAGDNTNQKRMDAVKGEIKVKGGKGNFHAGVTGHSVIVSTADGGTWAPPDVGAYVHGAIGVLGQAEVYRASGRAWGGNFIAMSNVAGALDVTGVEIGIDTRASVGNRVGLKIVILTGSDVSGTGTDYGVQIADKNAPQVNAGLLDVGIAFGGHDFALGVDFEAIPVKTGGTLIKTFGTRGIAHGIDFSSVPISGYAFIAANFSVTGAGAVLATGAVTSGALVSGTSLAVNAAALIGSERVYVNGAVLLANNFGYQVRDSGGTGRNLAHLNASDVVQLGSLSLDVTIAGGKHAFFGGTPVSKPSGGSAASDLSSVITLANLLRTGLRDLNLLS